MRVQHGLLSIYSRWKYRWSGAKAGDREGTCVIDHVQSDHLALENCMCPAWRKFNTYQKDVVLISSEEGEGWLDTMGVQHAKRSKARPVCSRSIVTRGLFDTGDICITSRSIVREVASFTRVMDTKRGIK